MSKFVTIRTWTALAAAAIFTAGCVSADPKTNSNAADEKALRDLVDRTVAAAVDRCR